MDTKSGYPFWVVKNGLLANYPQLSKDARCDVLVIGGGITGALIADHFARHDHEVIVVEQRDIGWGSTAASTALLQYEIDTPMVDLAKRYDESTAALAYLSCADAIRELRKLAKHVKDIGFASVDSLYLATKRRDASALLAENALRVRHGLPSQHLPADEVRERYGFSSYGALLTDLAASVDPYRLTCKLLARAAKRGTRVFDQTRITKLEPTARGLTVRTDRDMTIRAKHVIVAAGYESQAWLTKRVAANRSSYACVTDPLDPKLFKKLATTVLWESARPYHYVRMTSDQRLLVGGDDDAVDIPARRDARVRVRAEGLIAYARTLLPGVPLSATFAWAGTFAETVDGLPLLRSTPPVWPPRDVRDGLRRQRDHLQHPRRHAPARTRGETSAPTRRTLRSTA